MAEIFVSYRRADAAAAAGRLFDRLVQHFGAERVFRDVDSIEAGEDFERSIQGAIEEAAAVLVVIGPDWIEQPGADGTRRLEDPDDYVRREIEAALTSSAVLVPVLVDDARFPDAGRLPASIRALSRRNALELTNRHWQADVAALVRQLEALGVAPAESDGGVGAVPPRHPAIASLTEFFPDLSSLLREPRAFLRRRVRGRAQELTQALAFYVVSTILAVSMLTLAYSALRSVLAFGLTVILAGLFVSIVLSLPLWAGWRVVGVRRHYSKILVVMLYQVAVVHLAAFVAMTLLFLAADLVSRDVVVRAMNLAMQPDRSLQGAIADMSALFAPLGPSVEMRIALLMAMLIVLAASIWLTASWRAYRESLGTSRARSLVALLLAGMFGAVAVAALIAVV